MKPALAAVGRATVAVETTAVYAGRGGYVRHPVSRPFFAMKRGHVVYVQ